MSKINIQRKEKNYEMLRQIILHDIENQDTYEANQELYYKLKTIIEGRRLIKNIQRINEPIEKNISQFQKICDIFNNTIESNRTSKKDKEYDFTVAFIASRISGIKKDGDFINMLIDCIGTDRFKKINTINESIKNKYIDTDNLKIK